MRTRICAKCKKEKELNKLNQPYCRKCAYEYGKARYKLKSKEILEKSKQYPSYKKKNEYRIRSLYNIDLEIKQFILKNQEYTCPICKQLLSFEDACIDHDHITNKVRGLLHIHCNFLLGTYEKHKDKFSNMEEYLNGNSVI